MARRHIKKKTPATVTSGNYFPTLDIGLKNNYIYYNSLLMGTDENFAMNRVIGHQAENYLENVSHFKLQPSQDGLASSNADKAIKFLKTAADNERAKENAWLKEICEVLDVNFPTDPNSVDYIQILKILNEVQKGSKQALLHIKHEAERWANTDIERVLNSKKLQNSYEAKARNLERKQIKKGEDHRVGIELARKTGEDLYWGTRGRSGRPTDKNHVQTLARVIGEIDKTANKLFTGSGRGFSAQAEKLIVPYVTKALTLQSSTGRFKMDPHIMQTLYREVLIWIVEQIITDELSNTYIRKENSKITFIESNSKQRLEKVRDQMGSIGEEELIEQIQSIVRKNQYIDSLEIPAMTKEEAELKTQISQGNKDVDRIITRVVNNLSTDKNLQEEFLKEKGLKRVTKDSKKFQTWIKKRFQLNESFNKQAIEEAIKGSVRQSYEYSEEITVKEAAEQYVNLINSDIKGTAGYRPKGHPKTDVILGYINYNLEYEGDQIKRKRSELTELAWELEQAEREMDKLLRDAYDHNSQDGDELKKFEQYWIRRNASVKDYTRNAQTFEFIRQQQLQRLETLARTIEEREARTKAILTKYNVLETIKDQTGLLDTFVDDSKLRERGIGFSGGAMGTNSNGLSVIDNILALGKRGNLLDPETDAEWLKFALLNSGLGLVGHFNRYSLENYFSLFAAYLMFDDAQLIVSDALMNSAEEIGKKNSVQNIHLYVINGVYIPQSYILEELYKRMAEAWNGANIFNKRNLSEGTVRTQIYSYNVGSKYPGNTQEDWIRESNLAQQKVKIKMYFMMNFSDLVQQLAGMMGEI